MWVEMFLCLLSAHLIADFLLQNNVICNDKSERRWRSQYQYWHSVLVFVISWLVVWDLHFWWLAVIVGISHSFIDIWKSYREENVTWFILDQIMHLLVIALVSWLWVSHHDWSIPFGIRADYVAVVAAAIICWKPANILIKLALKHYSVNVPKDNVDGFNAGALSGTIERWLILIFVCLQRYDALGLLVAAKSIIRYSEKDTAKTEYVLAGTLLSIFIAVIAGLLLNWLLKN